MKTLFKLIGNLIAIVYGISLMPMVLIVLIVMPIKTILDGFKIIQTGYTVTGEYISIMIVVLTIVYISIRFRNLRKIYIMFPSLFETIKLLTITGLFIATGAEVLNWSHITLNQGRHNIGIMVFIASLVLWRIFISFYYTKKPLVSFIPKEEEKIQNYREKS